MSEVSASSQPRLSIILPAYNESRTIYANLARVCAALQGHDFEVIVVDDGSTDATLSESQRAAEAGLPVRVVRQDRNCGKGAALFHGLRWAGPSPF